MVKVSVIVPVYQVEKYLEKCLSSLVSQTLQEIEILVVNDGSTDSSQKIIENFQNRFPEKIKAFVKENGGLSDARNYGLDRVCGEFVGFVDSDDYVTEKMFEELYNLAKKHQAEMVICNLQKVNENGEVSQKLTQIPNLPEKIVLKEHFSVFSDLSYFACNKIFHRRLFESRRFKKGVHFEDIQLIPQLLLDCKILAQTQTYHYQYFERSDSITKKHDLRGLDMLSAVEDVEKYFEDSSFSERKEELKGFQILEGIYSFLAYLAFVKDKNVYSEMEIYFKKFVNKRNIRFFEILNYSRFGKNYFGSLPFKKKVFYLLYFIGLYSFFKKSV